MLGDDFSAADVMIGSMLGWCMMLGMIGDDVTNVQRYLAGLATRPAVARAQAEVPPNKAMEPTELSVTACRHRRCAGGSSPMRWAATLRRWCS